MKKVVEPPLAMSKTLGKKLSGSRADTIGMRRKKGGRVQECPLVILKRKRVSSWVEIKKETKLSRTFF